MIEIAIPGRGSYEFKHLVLDLNGTIALDGDVIEGVEERLQKLGQLLNISIVTADTHGSARRLEESLDIKIRRIEAGKEDAQKLALVQQLARENTISIGNGSNDVSMLRESTLGICVLGQEGASIEAIMNSDLVVPDINAALELLLYPDRLIATLRK
ncbi:MAG TPA: HAD hydrolase family protein [Dehalococcoidia bacterium]|nr:HAD hydrolase family protein [Dehalococcoidia bacterium]